VTIGVTAGVDVVVPTVATGTFAATIEMVVALGGEEDKTLPSLGGETESAENEVSAVGGVPDNAEAFAPGAGETLGEGVSACARTHS